jgi:hypothetical protein
MKKHFVMIVSFLALFACNSSKSDDIRSFIPGTYARFSDHEMRKEFDTLKIELISEPGNNYRLVRSSTFQKKLDGQSFPWERVDEEWIAIYDQSKRVLHETRKGKVISFVLEKNILLVGTTEYKKIK